MVNSSQLKKENTMSKASKWQQDPQNIKSKTAQFWRDGIMITAQMTQERARYMVKVGIAYVISTQAIGLLVDGERRG